ncbi:g4686 [Coccomyxa elongata]
MSDNTKEQTKQQGEGQMGLVGGVGPVLGGTAGGKDYSLATMLGRAEQKQSGDGKQDKATESKPQKDLQGPILSAGTQDLLEGSGLLQGAKGGWDPNKSPVKAPASAPGAAEGSSIGRSERPELHPAMSGGARTLLEGSGLLQSNGASSAKKE